MDIKLPILNSGNRNRLKICRKLLRTHTDLDGNFNDTDSGVTDLALNDGGLVSNQYKLESPVLYCLVTSLLEMMCEFFEDDPGKIKQLFLAICHELRKKHFINNCYKQEDLSEYRTQFRGYLVDMFKQLHINKNILNYKAQTLLPLRNSLMYIDDFHHHSRYKKDFVEVSFIGKGGFGVVCKAKNKIDGAYYAVKKISFVYSDHRTFKMIQREVETFAQLNHPNVVSYKTSWFENYQDHSVSTSQISNSYNVKPRKLAIRNGAHLKMPTSLSIEYNQLPNSYELDLLYHNHKTAFSNCFNENFPTNVISSTIQEISDSSSSTSSESNNISKEINSSIEMDNESFIQFESIEIEENSENIGFDTDMDCNISHSRKISRNSQTQSDTDVIFSNEKLKENESLNSSGLNGTTCQKLLPFKKCSDYRFLNIRCVLYIQMELCSVSLRQWLDERDEKYSGSLEGGFEKENYDEIMNIFRQVVKGVEHIHSHNLVHRDLKPHNIFFDQSKTVVKIGDFGLATVSSLAEEDSFMDVSTGVLEHSQNVGTTPYAAPEQRKGKRCDNRVDMYSLGIILFELLHPFGTKMEREKCISKVKIRSIPKNIEINYPNHAALILDLTNKDPKQRLSASQVLESKIFCNKSQKIICLEKVITEMSQKLSNKDQEIAGLKQELLVKDKALKESNNQLASTREQYLKLLKLFTTKDDFVIK